MATLPTGTSPQVPVVIAPATKKQPAKLSTTEKWLAALLIVGGLVLILILLSAFMGRSDQWSLKTKETSDVTDATTTTGKKVATSVEYSDSVLIAGLGIGGLLVLTGVFYGRIREITLPGGAGLKLGDLPEEKEQELDKAVVAKAEAKAGDVTAPVEAEALAAEARSQAQLIFQQRYWGAIPRPPQNDLDQIAAEAVERAHKILT
jgi:hypothetical protein